MEGDRDAAANRRVRPRAKAALAEAEARLTALAGERLAIEGRQHRDRRRPLPGEGGGRPAGRDRGRHLLRRPRQHRRRVALAAATARSRSTRLPMTFLVNDRWRVVVDLPGERLLRGAASSPGATSSPPGAATPRRSSTAGVDIALELEEGRRLIEAALAAGERGTRADKAVLRDALKRDKALKARRRPLRGAGRPGGRGDDGDAPVRAPTSRRYKTLRVFADREAAAFSAWYELMPRSQSGDAGPPRHLRRRDRAAALRAGPRLRRPLLPADPPDRPHQPQGPQQLPDAPSPDDPGSPYAIGAEEGGHDAIHPELGTLDDFDRLVAAAARARARDRARLRASMPRPTTRGSSEHPEWFDWRPDGTIKFAENPPKKYEDIVNFHFYREAMPVASGSRCATMFLFWCGARREASSASTTRTPSRSRSGSG